MSSEFGNALKVSVFGQSHGRAIGVTVDGFPAGEAIDVEALQAFLDRRRPGTSELTTARNETDCPEFLSGVTEDGDGNVTTCGFPLTAVIKNKDQHSSDYSDLLNKPRPSHADYTAFVKYGEARDMRGGGHFSGRLTAPLCIAGGICLQLLARRGIHIGAHLERVGEVLDEPFPLHPDEALFEEIRSRNPATIDPSASLKMIDEITNARFDNDSVGGIIECAVTGFPAGVGGPMFDGIEGELAKALFGIPAVKGVEFGNGFTAAELRGSQNNDAFIARDGTVETETNRSGGIQGGISNGMPLLFRVAVKPTPSIAKPQKTVDLTTMEETELSIHGRHDPCIAVRAVPVVEAVAAIALTDLLLSENKL
ncbi:MAG: chorismate synthase [Clostridia bacterium]|nr:chorismate synthase [Clostridia bacterium]